MSFSKDNAIIAQNSGTIAAAIVGKWDPNSGSLSDHLADFDEARQHIFEGALDLAGAETVVQAFEGGSQPAPQQQASSPYPTQSTPAQGGGGLGGTVVNTGKYSGKTFDQISSENPGWFKWMSNEGKNPFLKSKAAEYLAANPHLANAA